MNWRNFLFIGSIIISVTSILFYILFDFPFLFLLLLFPPFFLFNREITKESKLEISRSNLECKNCGKEIPQKNYKFCPYCGEKQDLAEHEI